MNIIKKSSPNFDVNRKPIDRIVIHWFGKGTLFSADNRFSNPDSKASAHFGISDAIVYQWVGEENVAYHAGNYAMNQRSIGIEHDATLTKNASEQTYKTSATLVREISDRYNIPLDRTHIIGHKEVKATQCPGTIDIDKIISLAKREEPKDHQKEKDKLRRERDHNHDFYRATKERLVIVEDKANQLETELQREKDDHAATLIYRDRFMEEYDEKEKKNKILKNSLTKCLLDKQGMLVQLKRYEARENKEEGVIERIWNWLRERHERRR